MFMKNLIRWPHMAIEGVLTRPKCAGKWGAQLYGPRVSNFLSHRIVQSSICMMLGKLEFQCTRNGPQNPPCCPGSPRNTFIIFSLIFQNHIFQIGFAQKQNLENKKSENLKILNPGSLTSAQTMAGGAREIGGRCRNC